MNERPIILVGGGGHCKSVIEAAESAGVIIKGILDIPENVGKKVLDYTVIGTDEDISLYADTCDFIVTVGFVKDASLRIKIHEKVMAVKGHFGRVIASTAHVSRYASIGEGSVIMHQAMVNAGAQIGFGCIINTFANIEHDAMIGDYTHISTGAMVNGDCQVGKRVFLGSQSVMVNGTFITDDCIVAAGSLARKSMQRSGIYAGNPAVLKIKL